MDRRDKKMPKQEAGGKIIAPNREPLNRMMIESQAIEAVASRRFLMLSIGMRIGGKNAS
jgi:hypothetical protein